MYAYHLLSCLLASGTYNCMRHESVQCMFNDCTVTVGFIPLAVLPCSLPSPGRAISVLKLKLHIYIYIYIYIYICIYMIVRSILQGMT